MIKRLTDFIVALVGIVLLAPEFLILAVAVRFSSPGPIIFCQRRVGLNGREFMLFKFRTMRPDSAQSGPAVTASDDPRITPLGRVLRRWKLDELPQLWNVLRGDMALVGPRPEVPQYVALWPADARTEILSVRPGLTDPAFLDLPSEEHALSQAADPQVYYREELLPKKVALYLRYIRERSAIGDLAILWRTLFVISKGFSHLPRKTR